jgi:lysophospholipase L1-like esterase
MKLLSGFLLAILFWFSAVSLKGQDISNENKNVIQFFGKSSNQFNRLFSSFNDLIIHGEGTINIVHLGDSHIQADFFTGQVRKRLVSEIASGCGARGVIFPFRIAKSNNPVDYLVKYSGKWESCRNVEYNKNCQLGLTGIMVKTKDSISDITFHFREASSSDFDMIRIYHNTNENSFHFEFPGLEGKYAIRNMMSQGFTEIQFNEFHKDSLKVRITRKDTFHEYFHLYGVEFINEDAGIVYNSAGVNGAEVISFLRCDLLQAQLTAINPGLVIISLGTNDAYPVKFDKAVFGENYKKLIRNIRAINPNIPVLLTIPGDSYRKRRYVNKNLPILRETIFDVARETDCAVWDFYSLMGGPRSIQKWYKAGLAAKDKLHFDKTGYIIQGDLFSDALLDSYSTFIDHSK